VNLEFSFQAIFSGEIEEYITKVIQSDFFSYMFDVTAISKDYIIPVYRVLTQKNVSAIYSFRLLSTHRTFDHRELIHNLVNNQTYTYTRVVESEYENKITGFIEFPPEYQQAGMSILTYFNSVINQKYPDTKVSITIKQEKLLVSMIIETPEGEKEKIEKALYDYGLVVAGKKTINEFTQDPLLTMNFQSQLALFKAQIDAQEKIMQYQEKELKNKDASIDKLLSRLENAFNTIYIEKFIQTKDSQLAIDRGIIFDGQMKGNINSGDGG
jgi:hypothetical protein